MISIFMPSIELIEIPLKLMNNVNLKQIRNLKIRLIVNIVIQGAKVIR